MPTPVKQPALTQITAWSYSRLSDYLLCPAKAKFKHVLRLKEPGNEAMDRGAAIHKGAEDYVAGELAKLPAELKPFAAEFKLLRKIKAEVEQEWAFTSDWHITGWFDSNAWCRIKVDSVVVEGDTVVVRDYKTGKVKAEEHAIQLELYALGAMLLYPTTPNVRVELWYIDHGVDSKKVFANTPAEVKRLKAEWGKRTRAMLADKRFAPRPGSYCRWCHFRKDNQGPCIY